MTRKFYCLLIIFILVLNNHFELAAQQMGGGEFEHIPQASECLSGIERQHVEMQISENIETLKVAGILPKTRNPNLIVFFGWPLQTSTGFSDYNYYGISNYVDQNPASPDLLLDWNCGDRTYDLSSGYNHQGVDIFTWPFPWHKMDNNEIEVVAAAPGVIVGKNDGAFDMQCSFNNDPANYVIIQHADGSIAYYWHMKSGSVTSKNIGATVSSGEYLGVVGSSGSSTGPHLHFEVEDASGNLIDPFAGPCNSINSSSWWLNQKPYYESQINKVMSNFAPVDMSNSCDNAIINESDSFAPGETVYLTTFYQDQLQNQISNYRVIRPNGTTFDSWTHNISEEHYAASWWWWSLILPSDAPAGTWMFEVNYEGQVYTHPFIVNGAMTECPAIDCGIINVNFNNGGEIVFCEDETVTLLNDSDPGIDFFIVDWGDGTIDTLFDYSDVTHAYNIPDNVICQSPQFTYIVNFQGVALCANGNSCQSGSYSFWIIPKPRAGFSSASMANVGENVTSIDQSCHAEDYLWSFGDGAVSILPSPSHVYNTPDNYVITQEVSNECGADQASQAISINANNTMLFYVNANALNFNADTICIPVNANNFNAVSGFQMTLNYDAELLEITPNNLSTAFFSNFQVDATTSTLLWADANGASLTLPDSSTVFTLKFVLPGNGQDCINVDFINAPLPILAILDGGMQQIPQTIGAESCIPQLFYDVAGKIHTEEQLALSGVEVDAGIGGVSITDANGNYVFNQLTAGNNYAITAFKNDNPLEGVNVADLVIIRDHILNTALLGSPYKRIAADVDGSLIINLLDLLWIRDLIIGFESHFPVNSWRFIPEGYPLPLPPNIVQVPSFVETLNLTPLTEDTLSADFIATKTGDVNATAEAFNGTPVILSIEDQYLTSGEEYLIPLDWEQRFNIQGLQLEVIFATEKINVIEKSPLIKIQGQAVHRTRNNSMFRILWLDGADKNPMIHLIAKENGWLSDFISFNESSSFNLTYADGLLRPCTISFFKSKTSGVKIVQAEPNPFYNEVLLKLDNSHLQKVRLEVCTIDGKSVYKESRTIPAGSSDWLIDSDSWKHKGLFYVKLATEENTQIITLVRE